MIPTSIFIYLMNKAVKNFCVTNITKKVTNSQAHTRTPNTQTYTTGAQIKPKYTVHTISFWASLLRPMLTMTQKLKWQWKLNVYMKWGRMLYIYHAELLIFLFHSVRWRGRGRRHCFCCCHWCYESLPSLSNEHFCNEKYGRFHGKTCCVRWWWYWTISISLQI